MKVICGIIFIICMVGNTAVMAEMEDPYKILKQHTEASGGIDAQMAVETKYVEGSIEIHGTGLKGTFKRWDQSPLKYRQEVDLGVFKQVSGDFGEFRWHIDPNGKLQINKDPTTMDERKLQGYMDDFEFLNRDSDVFTVTHQGMENVDDVPCHLIRITNNINDDINVWAIRSTDFYKVRETQTSPDMESDTLLSDFRDVNGVVVPFRQETFVKTINQRQTSQFSEYRVNPQVDPLIFTPGETQSRDFRFTEGDRSLDIPFEFIENHIYLKIMLDGRETLWVLDSGAGRSVIEKNFAESLGLKLEGQIEGKGAHGTVDVSFTTLPPFSLPGVEFTEQKIIAIDLAGLFQRALDLDVKGILGYDFLSRFVTKIDFANEKLSLYNPETFKYKGPGTVLETPIQGNMFAVPVTVDGKYTGNWTLDLGAGGSGFHYPFAEKNGLLTRSGVQIMARGAAAKFTETAALFETITIGEFTLHKPILGVPSAKGEGAFASEERIGNLGNTVFRHFTLYLDYHRQQVIFEKGADFETVFPVDGSGLQFERTDTGEIAVVFIAPGMPGEKSGFREGDVITAINGIPMEHFNGIRAIRGILKEDPGTKYTFDISRGKDTKILKLRLKNLFR